MAFDFAYVHTDIPPGMTCDEWRRRGRRHRKHGLGFGRRAPRSADKIDGLIPRLRKSATADIS